MKSTLSHYLASASIITILSAGLSFGLSTDTQAANLGFIGVLAGPSFINQDVGTKFNFGLNAGYNLYNDIGVGVYFTYTQLNSTAVGSTNLFNILAEGNYYFGSDLTGPHAGGKAGLGITSSSIVGSSSTTNLSFGPAAGYDYSLGSGLSIGGEINALFLTQSSMVTALNLLAALKYWF